MTIFDRHELHRNFYCLPLTISPVPFRSLFTSRRPKLALMNLLSFNERRDSGNFGNFPEDIGRNCPISITSFSIIDYIVILKYGKVY